MIYNWLILYNKFAADFNTNIQNFSVEQVDKDLSDYLAARITNSKKS